MGALSAMATADGAPSMNETLAVLEELDLDGLSDEGVLFACESVLQPPPLETSLEALRALPRAMLTEVMARLMLVARADGELQAAESVVLRRARELLDLGDPEMKRANRRADGERWRRRHALERARGVDGWRNLLVAVAGFGAPFAVIFRLGLEREGSPIGALLSGLDRLGQGHGLVAGLLVTMAISAGAAALTSGLTLRGRRAARLHREVTARSDRLRRNLRSLVDHVSDRLKRIQYANGPRVKYKILEGRLQAFHTALVRLRSDG